MPMAIRLSKEVSTAIRINLSGGGELN